MKLLVVIVSYRVTDLTIACLQSLEPEVRGLPGTRVAVCENGTGSDAEAKLRDAVERNGWGSWVDVTAISPNRGFTGGNNHVLRQALAASDVPEYVLLLNADTIVQLGTLRALVDFMDGNPQVGIAGSQLVSPEGVVQASPFRFMGICSELDRGLKLGIVTRLLSRYTVVPPTLDGNARADWVSGCSMIIRRRVLEEVGLLDEGLYTYFDDIDYCLNAKRKGWETWYVPGSRVVHLEGASTGIAGVAGAAKRRPRYWFQARRRFFLRNYGGVYTALCDLAFLVGFTLWRIRRVIQRKVDRDPPGMLGDAVRESVFLKGFRVREVENPAFAKEERQDRQLRARAVEGLLL
jgi:N-acetylglucosaminyl-diphospho-decaprenol L-rhamnosyltransferase